MFLTLKITSMIKYLLIGITLFQSFYSFSQYEFEVEEPDYIKSVSLLPLKINNYYPIIKLGESFNFKFDDLEGDEKEYLYKIEHYTHNWQLSNITSGEYLRGIQNDVIRDFENSFNTIQNYTHYWLTIPNNNMRITKSGNYVISVLDADEEVIFTRKFIVYEPITDVSVSAHKARTVSEIDSKQNVEFTINHTNLNINNPSKEIKIAIYQNNNWHTLKSNFKPQFYRNNQLIYKYGKESTFTAGNEFLYFDIKDLRGSVNNVRKVEIKDIHHARLYVDQQRKDKTYTYNPDVNGAFVIRNVNNRDNHLESEYANVHFLLESNINVKETESIYVIGGFNDWKLTETNKLKYNDSLGLYETELLLKQGFYNYMYVIANENNEILIDSIEGSFYQTENDYQVLVYYSKQGSRYDRVIGYGVGNSTNLQN